MKRIAGLAALLGSAALVPSAFAQETTAPTGAYWSVGYGFVSADDGFGDTADLGVIQGKVGNRLNANFGIEGELAIGVVEQSYLIGLTEVDVGIDYEYGLFGVAFVPVSPGFDLFARAGFVDMEISASSGGLSVSAGDTGAAFGAGGMTSVGGLNLRAEYTRYEFDDGGADSFTISIGGTF